MIEECFERAFKTAIERDGTDLFAQLRKVEEEAERDGVIYRNKAFPLLPKITVLTARQRDAFSEVAERMIDLLEKVLSVFANDRATRDYFMLRDSWLELAAIDPGYRRHIRISRFDAYLEEQPESFKLLENNTDCPAGVVFTGRVNHVLERVPAFMTFLGELPGLTRELIDGPDAFFGELLRAYEEYCGKRRPVGVAVLQLRDRVSAEAREMVSLLEQRGLPACVCDPRDLRHAGALLVHGATPVDLVWNKINTADFVPLLDAPDAPIAYLQACRDRSICQVNAFDARFVSESKLCAAYLREPAFRHHFTAYERELIDRYVPWSVKLCGNPSVEFQGEPWQLRDLALRRREQLVLKVAYDIRGDGVTVGRSATQAQWERALEAAWGRPYILQEFVVPRQLDVPHAGPPLGYQPNNFSVDLFMFGGRFAGFGSKLSQNLKVNVFQGGSKQALVSVSDPSTVCGRRFQVFGRGPEQGNAAVVVDGNGLSEDSYAELAGRFGVVTVYLLASTRAELRIRCFAPRGELRFCGHGLLAGAYAYGRDVGRDTVSVELPASIEVVHLRAGYAEFRPAQPLQVGVAPIDAGAAAALLGLAESDLALDDPLCIASIGSPKLLIPIDSPEKLSKAQPALSAIASYSEQHDVHGVYPYHRHSGLQPTVIDARGMNPRSGLAEDAATSVAAAALAGVLARQRALPAEFRIRQGQGLGRPSEMFVRVDSQGISVGGCIVSSGKMRVGAGATT